VHWGVRFLDDVVEVNRHPQSRIEAVTRSTRKIGLGVMGFADLLIRRGISYGSEEALAAAGEVMSFIHRESLAASENLAKERGGYPAFPGSPRDCGGGAPVRNATVNTIAPTGTLSLIAGVSSGIEPIFAFSCERHVLDTVLHEEHPQATTAHPDALITARGVPPEWHVRMQAVFQRHVDNAVSKTINFPADATVEDVRKAFLLADELECKGITVYRDRSRRRQVLNDREGNGFPS
jgi:ribonucleoside-diphosphate reductase alpha chain